MLLNFEEILMTYFLFNRDDLNYVEITEIRFSQSVEYPITPKDTTIIGGTVSSKNGIGSGNFLVGYRRQTSDKGWLQVISRSWF